MDYLQEVTKKRRQALISRKKEETTKQSLDAVKNSGESIRDTIIQQNAKSRTTVQKVDVQNDLASKQDIDQVIAQLKEVQLASLLGGQQKPSVVLADSTDLGERIESINNGLQHLATQLANDDKAELKALATKLESYFKAVSKPKEDKALASKLDKVITALSNIDVSPNVNVSVPDITVPESRVDISPLQPVFKEIANKLDSIKIPKQNHAPVVSALDELKSTIENLRFPTSNFILPYRSSDGAAIQKTIETPSERLFERVSNTDGNSTAFTDFGATTGKKNYIKGYSITNTSSSNGYVDFKDGTSGDILWTVPIPANGGANLALDEPIFWTSANTALAYDVSSALTTVYISVTGYQTG